MTADTGTGTLLKRHQMSMSCPSNFSIEPSFFKSILSNKLVGLIGQLGIDFIFYYKVCSLFVLVFSGSWISVFPFLWRVFMIAELKQASQLSEWLASQKEVEMESRSKMVGISEGMNFLVYFFLIVSMRLFKFSLVIINSCQPQIKMARRHSLNNKVPRCDQSKLQSCQNYSLQKGRITLVLQQNMFKHNYVSLKMQRNSFKIADSQNPLRHYARPTIKQIQQKHSQLLNVRGDPPPLRVMLKQESKRAYVRSILKTQNLNQTKVQHHSQKPIKKRSVRHFKSFTQMYQIRSVSDPSLPYRDLLWKVCFSFGIAPTVPQQLPFKYKYYIGNGNNACLIRSLFKQRKWWSAAESASEEVQFIWTTSKLKTCFSQQKVQEKCKKLTTPKLTTIGKQFEQTLLTEKKLLNERQMRLWLNYFKQRYRDDYRDSKLFVRNGLLKGLRQIDPRSVLLHNHLEFSHVICNKKQLYLTLRSYCSSIGLQLQKLVPKTFHIKDGLADPVYRQLVSFIRQQNDPSLFIVKPGQLTNRGRGILVCRSEDQVSTAVKKAELHSNGSKKTYIVQEYISPMLYRRRKFDIRHYLLIISFNGRLKGMWYEQGYIRTSSKNYREDTVAQSVHLTNDSIQHLQADYGKYQKGNKLSYTQFDQYTSRQLKFSFKERVVPQMMTITKHLLTASLPLLNASPKNNFQLLGLDFIVDREGTARLIQVNSNPCLDLASPHLSKLIPSMLQNTLRIGVDSLFQPPLESRRQGWFQNALESNRFSVLFDEESDSLEQYQFIQ